MSGIADIISPIFGNESSGEKAAGQAADAQAGAYREGAQIQSDAIQKAIDEMRSQFEAGKGELDPYSQAGLGSLEQQQALLGLLGEDKQSTAMEGFKESPGQKYLREKQEKALLQNAAAIGGLGGGNVRTALQEQAAGIAATDYDNYYNKLSGLTGGGQNAAANIAQIGSNFGANAGNMITQQGNAMAGGVTNAANARASGIIGQQQARAANMGNLINIGGMIAGGMSGSGDAGGAASPNVLSDKKMKKNIRTLDTKKCFDAVISMPLKSWKYLEELGIDENTHIGPMAQDAPDMIKIKGKEVLSLHDELMMIAGAMQHMLKGGLNVVNYC